MFDVNGSELVSFEGSDTVVSVPVGVTNYTPRGCCGDWCEGVLGL